VAEAVNRVLGDPQAVARLRAAALAAKQELNWEVESRKLLDIYASLGLPVLANTPAQETAGP
jgi:glycosyltransferase involved in cell wall biosynthesis